MPVASKPNGVTLNTDCREHITAKDLTGDLKCEDAKIQILDAETKALDAQGKTLDRQGKALDSQGMNLGDRAIFLKNEQACKDQILEAAKAKKVVLNFPQPRIGEFCATARRLGLKVSGLQKRESLAGAPTIAADPAR
ncbi:MAG: hypothetical protein QOJ86_5026 [Bradyrhizobium sp.]|nr:hypothetical protein [Bradyrhizobium sp.]